MSDIIDESILHKKRINDLLVSVEGLKKENRKRCVEVLYENNLTTERRIRAHLILNPDLLTENSVDKYDSDDIIAYLLNEIPTTPSLQVEAGTFAHFQPIGIMLTLFCLLGLVHPPPISTPVVAFQLQVTAALDAAEVHVLRNPVEQDGTSVF